MTSSTAATAMHKKSGTSTLTWQEITARKRQMQREQLDEWTAKLGEVGGDDEVVTKATEFGTLRRRLAGGEVSAERVAREMILRAIDAHSKTNCLTELNFSAALSSAQDLDKSFNANKKPIGPLHGIPMTVKDQFNLTNLDTTLGYCGRAFQPATSPAVLVSVLESLGAVILAKTNLPQSIMWCETENPLWGLTTHPANPLFTPGGSTGGEGALLSLGGSMVGWGTDIGGSIRIPAHMNGLWGLKPSSSRLPYLGVPVSTEGQQHVPSSIGPLSRTLDAIHLVTKSIIDSQPWKLDPSCVPIPWREELYASVQSRPLTIGLITTDNVVRPHPPVSRTLQDFASKLRAAGHEVIDWTPDYHSELIDVLNEYYTADGGEDVQRDIHAAGEPFLPHVDKLFNHVAPMSVYDYWQLNRRKLDLQKKYLDKWEATRGESGRAVDVLLLPTMPHTAVPHRTCRWVGYTKVWNVLDYPAMSFPAGAVDRKLDGLTREEGAYRGVNETDRWNWEAYDVEAMHGLPVGLQIVGRKLEEETVLGVGKVFEGILNGCA